jgi:integrating conjugative element membrane protein (TIGR03745 family)
MEIVRKDNVRDVTVGATRTVRNSKVAVLVSALLAVFSPLSAHAALPTTAPPSRGATAGNYLKLFQDYGYDAALVAGLLLSAFALFKVAGGALAIYHEVQEGKKKWGDMGMHVLVGVGLLMFIVYIATQASGVL